MSDEQPFEMILSKMELASNEAAYDESDLIHALAARIAQLLDTEPGILFSTLYRLDVLEHKIDHVLKSADDTALGLAHLVFERQKEKISTRKTYGDNVSGDFDFLDE